MKNIQKIVFFGGGALLGSIIDKLLKSNFQKNRIFIVTSERHSKEKIKDKITLINFLNRNKIDFKICKKLSIKEIKKKIYIKKTLFVSIGSPWIFNSEFIKSVGNEIYNIHGSQLPMNRGGGGFTWQILQDDTKGYVSLHKVVTGIDKGDIILTKSFVTKKCRNPLEFQNLYIKEASNLFMKFLKKKNKKVKINSKKQNENLSSYWPRLNTQIHGWINWDWTAQEISKFIKGFDDPYVGAHTTINNKIIYLKNVTLVKNTIFHPFQSGIIYRKNSKGIFVCAKNGALFLKGFFNKNNSHFDKKYLKLGDRFFTPSKYLENAKKVRKFYNEKLK